jgi:hypothetical protein
MIVVTSSGSVDAFQVGGVLSVAPPERRTRRRVSQLIAATVRGRADGHAAWTATKSRTR